MVWTNIYMAFSRGNTHEHLSTKLARVLGFYFWRALSEPDNQPSSDERNAQLRPSSFTATWAFLFFRAFSIVLKTAHIRYTKSEFSIYHLIPYLASLRTAVDLRPRRKTLNHRVVPPCDVNNDVTRDAARVIARHVTHSGQAISSKFE